MHAKKEAKGLNNEPQKKMAARGVRIPIGKSSARQMIEAGFYADKTDYIAKLFEDDGTYYFFIRPRRFGKSLLLDTIDQIAQGNKALFKTCAIYTDQTYKWQKYPVVWLNFSELVSKEPDLLEEDLKKYLYRVAQTYNIKGKMPDPTGKDSIQSYFLDLFNELMNFPDHKSYAKQPIILIDEYDSPLISCKKEQYDDVLFVLSSFFKVLKGRQKDCKFIFVTGVTKFHLSGLTSGANSANDISLHEDYAAMLGYTDDDVDHLFLSKDIIVNPVLEKLNRNKTQEEKYTLSQVKRALKDYYNGYCFTADKTISVYNPDSILKFFDEKKFGHYWFNRGNPTILASQMKNDIDRFNIDWDKDKFVMSGPSFEYVASGLHQIPILPLMYQTGYLTLDPDGFKEDTREEKNTTDYYLKFPNQEVKSALKLILSDFIAQNQQETGRVYSTSILDSLRNKQWSAFLNYIRSDCLAKAGYRFLDKTEKSFQRALYLFLNGAFHATQSMQTSAESDSGVGRTDIVMEDHRDGKRAVYIFELKIDKPALDALKQIHTKDYSIQYGACSEKVLIGLTCDAAKLNITQAVVEVHQRDEQDNFKDVFRRHFTVGQSGYFKEATSQ